MKLHTDTKTNYWYKYINSALIYNAWDSACEAMNGADKDGDTNMCTDNPVILKNTLNSPTIICLQRRADKVIPTEEDIIKSNKLAFNDEIGEVTNHVTAMIVVRDKFPKESVEYEALTYRIMCGQLFQQNTIDRAKGIIAKSMPVYWYSMRDCIIKDGDDEETIRLKKLSEKIVASKKPYFMCYVYPKLKSENLNYIKNNEKSAIRRFGERGILSIQDLENYKNKPQDMMDFLAYYHRLSPVNNGSSVVNRICWLFEKEFSSCLSKIAQDVADSSQKPFDYSILRSETDYSAADYEKISEIYCEYKRKTKLYKHKESANKTSSMDNHLDHLQLIEYFKSECSKVCPNEDELCNIILDMCYQSEKSKQFAWDICGDVILRNLLRRSQYQISYPVAVSDGGEFTYNGIQFKMESMNIKENGYENNTIESD